MKKYTVAIAIASLTLGLAPVSTVSAKNNSRKVITASAQADINVKQYTTDENFVYVQIDLKQNNEKPASLRITDDQGEVLYAERISSKNHSFLAKFSPSELSKIQVELYTVNGILRKAYKVENKTFSTVIVEEIAAK